MLETKKGFKKGKILIPKSKNSRKTIDYTKKKIKKSLTNQVLLTDSCHMSL